jgi:hypothetical protein
MFTPVATHKSQRDTRIMSCYLAAKCTSNFLLDRHRASRRGRAADCSPIMSTLHSPRQRLMRFPTIYRSFNLHCGKRSRASETDLDNFTEKNKGEFSHIQIRNTFDLHAFCTITPLLGWSVSNLHTPLPNLLFRKHQPDYTKFGIGFFFINFWNERFLRKQILLLCVVLSESSIHSFSSLSYDRSRASPKASSPHSAI